MTQPASPSITARANAKALLRGRTLAQWYCLVVGVLLGLRGATTLIFGASFAQPGTGWRAIQQLLVASVLIAVQRRYMLACRALLPFAVFYLVLWTVGVVNGHAAFGLIPINTRDKVLYILYAVFASIILVLGSQRSHARRD